MKLPSIKGIPLEYIQSILKIDLTSPSKLTWIPREDGTKSWNTKHANKHAGYLCTDNRGYESWKCTIRYNDKKHDIKCSRVVFLLHNGYLTDDKVVDHATNKSLDNSIENLREATQSQNSQNSKLRKNNNSGTKGLSWNKKRQKWEAKLYVNYKKIHIGYFLKSEKENAKKAIEEARKKYHGEFGRDE
jgi:hypothetical protein